MTIIGTQVIEARVDKSSNNISTGPLMNTSLYTPETARWYSLLSQAQAQTNSYFDSDVERYIADMLFRFGCDAEGALEYPKEGSVVEWNSA